ncbi:MAG: hypothetical protein GX264_04870 [Clostridiales bacterium]|jgi:hypothetical protein|nr:hypothetical protein [Clostridiales bacterium]
MLFSKKKKNKNQKLDRFKRLLAGGVEVKALNCRVFAEDDIAILEITVPEVTEALHYDELDFELFTTSKHIKMKGEFKDADRKGKFRNYRFKLFEYNEFFE